MKRPKSLHLLPHLLFLLLPHLALGQREVLPNPDFTEGEKRPAGASHDWNLGATGMRGWMHSEKLETTKARQILVTEVAKGSPADQLIKPGDVLLGVGGEPFGYDPRTEFGRALTLAESPDGKGKFVVTRWREGATEEVTLNLPVLGYYSLTAPFQCQKSQAILKQGCERLVVSISDPKYRPNAIVRSLNALALLASGDPKYLPTIQKEAAWAKDFSSTSFQTWWYSYVITFLAEYHLATGDDSVLPGLRRLAMEASEGQSIVGSWGHKFAGKDGRLVGYGMMNAPGVPLTIALHLTREAGIQDPKIDEAIEKSAKLLRFYVGKGAVPYGDHDAWIQTHEDNGKCGMASVLFHLLGEKENAQYFSRMSLASHGGERDGGHTGNFTNMLWSVPGISPSGPQATGIWMKEFGSWYFDLARVWDGSFIHQGPPDKAPDKYRGWDSTGAYLLAYALPLKKLRLFSGGPRDFPEMTEEEASSVFMDGIGWINGNRNSFYDTLDVDQLLARLGNWSPVVRERSAMALARKKASVTPQLLKMLSSPETYRVLGATRAVAQLRLTDEASFKALRENLNHKDLWVRVKSAEALAQSGDKAKEILPELLERLAQGPSAEDPRGMEQRYLNGIVFGTILKRSIEGVDLALLRKAIAAGLQNQDGRSRSSVGQVYQHLTYEQIKPLLPAIYEAVKTPAPSGIMFASGVRLAGLDLLAKHRIEEGMALCLDVMEIENWGKGSRVPRCVKALASYRAASRPLLPQMKARLAEMEAHREQKNLAESISMLRRLISEVEASDEEVPLRSLKNL